MGHVVTCVCVCVSIDESRRNVALAERKVHAAEKEVETNAANLPSMFLLVPSYTARGVQ